MEVIIQTEQDVVHVQVKDAQNVEHQMENVPNVSVDIIYQDQHV